MNIVSRIVEVCVLKTEGGEARYLLLRRSSDDKIYPGIWQFVTGSVKDGERAVDAALREFHEETGMDVGRFWVVPFVNSFYVPVNDTVHVSPVFAVEVNPGGKVRLSSEHQAYQWCTYEEANEKLVWPGQRYALKLVRDYFVGGQEASRLLSLSTS